MVINDDGNFEIEIYDHEWKSIKKILDKEKTLDQFFKKEVIMWIMSRTVDAKMEKFFESKEMAYKKLQAAVSKWKTTPEQQLNLINKIAEVKDNQSVKLPDALHQEVLGVVWFAQWRERFLDLIKEEKPEWYDYLVTNYAKYYEKNMELFAKTGKKIYS